MIPPPAFGDPLTPQELAFLESQGDLAGLGPDDEDRFHCAAAETVARDLASSRTADEVARLLGTSAKRIAHAGLFSFAMGESVRFPLWQLVKICEGSYALLPHLHRTIDALPEGLSHTSLRGFMTTPQRDLVIERSPASPTSWLVLGGDSAVVCGLLASIELG